MFPTKQRSWGRRVCLVRKDVTNKQDPKAKRKQAERVEKVDRGEGAGSISTSESPRLASPGALGRGGLGGTRGLWHPSPI